MFKNYCIVILGETKNSKLEIEKISEGSIKYVPGRNIILCTFLSILNVGELTEYFKSFDKNFLLFEINNKVSGFNIKDKTIEEQLFGTIHNDYLSELTNMSSEFLDFISKSMDNTGHTKTVNKDMVHEIDTLSKKEMQTIIDEILNKGVENITKNDKLLLEKISKRL